MPTGNKNMSSTVVPLFRDFIAARGLNMSRQRALILEAFLSAPSQFSVDELYIKLRLQHPSLGRSTVYRTMKLIVACRIARIVVLEGAPVQYEKCRLTGNAPVGNQGRNR